MLAGVMRSTVCRIIVLALLWLGTTSRAAADFPTPDIRMRMGDDPRWAAPDFDDSDWQRIHYSEFPAREGPYWIRIRHSRPPSNGDLHLDRYAYAWVNGNIGPRVDGFFLSSVFAYELYLDGRLLDRSGVVGHDRDSEVAGLLDHLIRIPEELRGPGEHVVALRMSSYRYNFPATQMSVGVQPVNFAQRLKEETVQPIFPLIGAVSSVLMAATSVVLFWFLERRRTLWLVCLVSLVLGAFYALIAVRWLAPYNFDWHYPRLVAITATLAVACFLLVWLLLEQFEVPRKAWWLALFAPLVAIAWSLSDIYEQKAFSICRAMLVVALVITAWACWRRRSGAWLALPGIAVALFVVRAERRAFLDPTFFLTIAGIVLLVFAAVGARVQAERRRARDAMLTAMRLEAEMLKKNLQPHFLLNTLTALSEVIERNPTGAVGLIDDLAGVLRSLSRMSGEKLVTLNEELELCRAHLRVVSVRMGLRLSLVAPGVDGATKVPPAVFLTLIENGLVHQQPDAGMDQEFTVEMARSERSVRFRFLSPGATRTNPRRVEGGTGLRYIKARLEESFPGTWKFAQQATPAGWETSLEFPSPA